MCATRLESQLTRAPHVRSSPITLTWQVVINRSESILEALEIEKCYQISFWDALIVHARMLKINGPSRDGAT